MKLSPPPPAASARHVWLELSAFTHHIYSLSTLHAQNLIWSSQHCISLRVEWWTMSLCSSSPQHHESFIQMSLWQRCHNLPLIQRTWQPGERHFRLRRILHDAPSTSRRHQLTGRRILFIEKSFTGWFFGSRVCLKTEELQVQTGPVQLLLTAPQSAAEWRNCVFVSLNNRISFKGTVQMFCCGSDREQDQCDEKRWTLCLHHRAAADDAQRWWTPDVLLLLEFTQTQNKNCTIRLSYMFIDMLNCARTELLCRTLRCDHFYFHLRCFA